MSIYTRRQSAARRRRKARPSRPLFLPRTAVVAMVSLWGGQLTGAPGRLAPGSEDRCFPKLLMTCICEPKQKRKYRGVSTSGVSFFSFLLKDESTIWSLRRMPVGKIQHDPVFLSHTPHRALHSSSGASEGWDRHACLGGSRTRTHAHTKGWGAPAQQQQHAQHDKQTRERAVHA